MRHNIKYICTRVKYSQEFFYLKSYLHPYCEILSVRHLINVNQFKDFNQKKEYDLLFYGSDYKKSYPFRHRLKKLLQTPKFQDNFKIRIVEWKENLRGEALSKEINKAYETNDFLTLFIYSYESKYYDNFKIDEEYITIIENEIKKKEDEINNIKNKIHWKWVSTENELEKQIIEEYIKTHI